MREKIVHKLFNSYLRTLGPFSTNGERLIAKAYRDVLLYAIFIVGGEKTKLGYFLKTLFNDEDSQK